MAIYSLDDIHALVSVNAWDYGTRNSRAKAQSYGMTRDDVARCLLALTHADFQKEFGEAQTEYGVLMTDAYVTEFDGLFLYVKFGLHEDHDGTLCVVASLHT